jgi:hypothetical protein
MTQTPKPAAKAGRKPKGDASMSEAERQRATRASARERGLVRVELMLPVATVAALDGLAAANVTSRADVVARLIRIKTQD